MTTAQQELTEGQKKTAAVVPPSLQKEWMSDDEAAEQLALTKETIRMKAAAGVLEAKKHGRSRMVTRKSVKRYLSQFRVN